MSKGSTSRESSNEDIDIDEIPPVGAPILGLILIYTVIEVGFSDPLISLAFGGAGVAMIAAFSVKTVTLYKQKGAMKAIDYAITAPADREEDYSINLKGSSGIEKTEKGITLDHLKQIDPYEFEEFVAKVWNGMGYETKVTQGAQDRGIDVVAEKAEPYNKKKLIQAKRNGDGNKVSAPTVRKCGSLKHDNSVDEVLVATTTSFTSQAHEEADKYNVKLIDGKKLLQLYEDNVEK